eukprot:SAG22_NODE_2120_length_2981_cov_1.324080_6_plen_49_part_00
MPTLVKLVGPALQHVTSLGALLPVQFWQNPEKLKMFTSGTKKMALFET